METLSKQEVLLLLLDYSKAINEAINLANSREDFRGKYDCRKDGLPPFNLIPQVLIARQWYNKGTLKKEYKRIIPLVNFINKISF